MVLGYQFTYSGDPGTSATIVNTIVLLVAGTSTTRNIVPMILYRRFTSTLIVHFCFYDAET